MPSGTPPERREIRVPWGTVAGVLGWLVPGLGHLYVGRPAKGLLFALVILGTYALGLFLSGWTCVNPVRDPIWFSAQAVAAVPTLLTAWLTRGLEATERLPTYDVGLLYVTVAALLNAVAISDVLGTVNDLAIARYEEEEALDDARDAAEAQAAAEAAAAAAAASAAASAPEPAVPSPFADPSEPPAVPDAEPRA